MLAKLKPRLRRIKSSVERYFRGTKSNQVIDTGLEENVGGFDWTGLDDLVETLGRDAEAFQPLASAIDKLSIYIKRLETYQQVPKEYSGIRNNMNDLFLKLFGILNDPKSSTIVQGRAANLARSLESEMEPLLRLGENWSEVDAPNSKRRANEVVRHLRRLKALMGYFIIAETVGIVSEPAPDVVLDRLPRSLAAALYRSPNRDTIPRTACTDNTRVDVLQEIKDWIRYGNSRRVYWLSGMAGSGKTTIAYTLCDYLEKSGRPNASYFCARRLPACRKACLVLPEVSYQLSLLSRPFLCALHDAIDQDVPIREWPIHDQFERLIAMPLRRVGHMFSAPPVVIIDALDECEEEDEVNDLLETLLAHTNELPIKFVLTSRREAVTINRTESANQDQVLSEQSLDKIFHLSVQEDMRTYLVSELRALDLSSNELESFAEQLGGSFRYAAWLVKYILGDDTSQAGGRMLRLLDVSSDQDGDGQADATYEAILDAILSKDFYEDRELVDIRLVLHSVAYASMPFTTGFLASFLAELPDLRLTISLESALQALHPVLLVSPMDGLLTPRYKLFRRYMLDQKRSGKHHCTNATKHYITQLTLDCFDIIRMPYPPYNICNLPSSYLRDREVPRMDDRIESAISHDLLDTCRQWGVYIELSQPCNELVSALHDFLSSRLLLWMEVLNLKQCMRDGLEQLRKARTWLKGVEGPDNIQTLLEDAEKFVAAFLLSPLSEYTPHIYVSMLPLWPEDSPVSQRYMQRMSGLVRLECNRKPQGVYWLGSAGQSVAYSPGGRYVSVGTGNMIQILDTWTQELIGQPLRGHTSWVNTVAYSPDGAHIASSSDDKTIRIWDAHTGQSIGQPLQGHTNAVKTVAYSPDGAHIASGSFDNTVRIWNAHTGQPIGQLLQGHISWVNTVAYSPDGTHIASGSFDNTVRIWDAHTGQPIGQPLQGHTSWVNTVAYSPDGAHIASGSSDHTVRIWDAHTGQPIGQPLQGHTSWVNSVAYSPDGAHIASGSFDNTVRIWDAHTGQPIGQPLQGHTKWVDTVAYSPDGAHIASGSSDNTVRIWDAGVKPPADSRLHNPESSPSPVFSRGASLTPVTAGLGDPPGTIIAKDWRLDEDGWVVDANELRLVWIPAGVRAQLVYHPTRYIIFPTSTEAYLDLSHAKLGEDWVRCFDKIPALDSGISAADDGQN